VELRVGAAVSRVDLDSVRVGEETIPAATVVWAAGVTASPLARTLGVAVDRAGRVSVSPDLSLPEHPDIFAIGDLALCPGPDGRPRPGLAPVAMQQGRAAADNARLRLAQQPTRPFRYVDLGTMATIGRSAAIAEIGPIRLHGRIAWLAWVVLHIFRLIGF